MFQWLIPQDTPGEALAWLTWLFISLTPDLRQRDLLYGIYYTCGDLSQHGENENQSTDTLVSTVSRMLH